ncbi:hypothetical protein ACFFRR_004034 [Megaselia abdita]
MKGVLILGSVLFLLTVKANNQCETEADGLQGSPFHETFIKDCIDSGEWKTTLDLQANAWEKCKKEHKLTNYQECLNNNRIYKTSMIPSFDCYYEELQVLSLVGYNKYRYAKTDALYYNTSQAKLYQVYSQCLDGKEKPVDSSDSVKFYECVAQKIYDEGSDLMLKEWKQSPNYTQDFEECKKAIDGKLVTSSFLSTLFLTNDFLPYVKCVFGRMGFLENGCFYGDRLDKALEKNGDPKVSSKCFHQGVGESDFEFLELWNCLVKNNVLSKFQ